jgi:hypothetical protein
MIRLRIAPVILGYLKCSPGETRLGQMKMEPKKGRKRWLSSWIATLRVNRLANVSRAPEARAESEHQARLLKTLN